MTATKKKLPAHGHLGMVGGTTKAHVRSTIREIYIVPPGARIEVEFQYKDAPFNIYEVEVILGKRKVTRK